LTVTDRSGSASTTLAVGIGGAVGLYLVEQVNFLLFHSIVELFSVLVAFAVFVITWNSRAELSEHPFLTVVAVAYLFVGGIDGLHALAYKGMGVFPAAGADLPTQLWVFSRYVESISLLGAGVVGVLASDHYPLSLEWRKQFLPVAIGGYGVFTAVGLATIFVFDTFPQAYAAGSGLTQFKILSEYAVVGLFVLALGPLYLQRERFDQRVFRLLVGAVVLTACAELAFTFYVEVYGFSNTVGHFLKFGSFYLIYIAVVRTGIREPQRTLYRELARREAEARKFQRAVDHSGHAVVITDADGTIQYVNPAYEEITGYTAEELRGSSPAVLQSGEHGEAFYEDLWETVLSGDVWQGEIVDERKNGEEFVLNQTIAPIFGPDEEIQHLVAITDEITERTEYRERLESELDDSLRQLEVLDRVLRHNVRNSMNVVVGSAEMIQERSGDDDAIEFAETIIDTSERLVESVDKERQIVKLLSKHPERTTVDLVALVEPVVSNVRTRYPHAELSSDLPKHCRVTATPAVSQAVEELLVNAIEHTDEEAPTVSIHVECGEERATVTVVDDGPGIPEMDRTVVADGVEIDQLHHGSGLGLWLVDIIVRQSGGELLFSDANLQGSEVSISLDR
jgi:PAS domain S-box-containing protein